METDTARDPAVSHARRAAEIAEAQWRLSRLNETTIRARLAAKRAADVSRTTGITETWLSRWKSAGLGTIATILAALGLAVVPEEAFRHAELLRMQLLGDE